MSDWHGKPYYSLDAYCKNTFHHKCYKIALNAHMTCPNRDGSAGTRGCIFCSAGGSGEFAVSTLDKSIEEQLAEGLARLQGKFRRSASHADLIAYFQAYTNTYAPVPYLEQVYRTALDCPQVCGISIATRPDCLPAKVLELLSTLKASYPEKFIWVELGLQTIHETTADVIRRGYDLHCFEEAFRSLETLGIPVIIHLILGLPGETHDMMLESIRYVNRLLPFGVKLQLLHILKGTDLGELYCRFNESEIKQITTGKSDIAWQDTLPEDHLQLIKDLHVMEKEEYLDLLVDCLRHLSPQIVIHRLTGDGPKKSLIAPLWSADKRDVLNSLHRLLKETGAVQGECEFKQ